MSRRPEYVSEEPMNWDDGFVQALADPNHYRRREMAVVDYSAAPAELGPAGWQPLLNAKPEPPEQPTSRWALLRALLRGKP
jgi:hypothetical protein